MLCTLSATLLVSYGEDPAEFRNDLPQESFDLELPYGMSRMGVCLLEESSCWGFMHGETAGGNETDVELELKATFSVPLAEVVM